MSQNEGRVIGQHHGPHPVTLYRLPHDAVVLEEGRSPNHVNGQYRVWVLPFAAGWKGEPAVFLKVDVEGRCGDVYDETYTKQTGIILKLSDLETMRQLMRRY